MQRWTIVIAAILAATVLASCRQEQDHPFVEGSNYDGPADMQLTPAQVNALNNRIALQGESNVSAGAAVRPTEERPTPPTAQTLDKRLQEQAGPIEPKEQPKK
jgi:hypothetical protein